MEGQVVCVAIEPPRDGGYVTDVDIEEGRCEHWSLRHSVPDSPQATDKSAAGSELKIVVGK